MKATTIITLVNTIASALTSIGSDVIETLTDQAAVIEEKSRNAQLRQEWFSRFHSLPVEYRVTTQVSDTEKVSVNVTEGVLLMDNESEKTWVATVNHEIDGSLFYELRNIFTTATKRIDPEKVTVLYTGSVENCWLRWYAFEKKNLG